MVSTVMRVLMPATVTDTTKVMIVMAKQIMAGPSCTDNGA